MVEKANQAEIEHHQLGRIRRGEINTTVISQQSIAEILKMEVNIFLRWRKKKTKRINANDKSNCLLLVC
jgi:hypothetical protein